MRIQRADVKKALASTDKKNLGGNAAVLGSEVSHVQGRKTGRKTRINYEEG